MPSSSVPKNTDLIINGINSSFTATKMLNSLDKLEEAVYNGDLTPEERGKAIRVELNILKEIAKDVGEIIE